MPTDPKPTVPEWVALIANGGEPHPVAECYECRDKLDFLAAVLREAEKQDRYMDTKMPQLLRWSRAQGTS